MLRIYSFGYFIKVLLAFTFVCVLSFRAFHYFYPYNYCDVYSNIVDANTKEETEMIKRCVNTLVCELGNSEYSMKVGSDRTPFKTRDFSCIRRYEAGVIKLW